MQYQFEKDDYLLELDTEDPYTPALVISPDGETATYFCALDTGVLASPRGHDVEIPQHILKWLASFETMVQETFEIARAGMPEYN